MADTTQRPAFVGRALLLLLPMLMLAAVGLNSLRQDRILAQREAADHARRLAEAILAECAAAISTTAVEAQAMPVPAFQVDADGRLLFPPEPGAGLSPRPLLLSALTREQADLWRKAQECEAVRHEPGAAIAAYSQFLLLSPPADFAAHASYSLGLVLAARGNVGAAVRQWRKLVDGQTDARAESGLPLLPLACLKLLEWQPAEAALLSTLGSNLVYHPTSLTPALLREAAQDAREPGARAALEEWGRLWQRHEQARRLFGAARAKLGETASAGPRKLWPRAFWFSPAAAGVAGGGLGELAGSSPAPAAQWWVAMRGQQSTTSCWFHCRTEVQAAAEFSVALAKAAPVPEYFSIEIRLAGRALLPAPPLPGKRDTNTDTSTPELLGTVRRSDSGAEWLAVNVYLTQPALLYAQQHVRRVWFGWLIAVSAAAALAGWWTTWRAVQRQRRLSELKDSFVASVSHELRTPLAAVRLLVEGLESGQVTGALKQQEYLGHIRRECRRLSALIENILDFSLIEQGRQELHRVPTDLTALVEQTVKLLEPWAAERSVSITACLPDTNPACAGLRPLLDSRGLRQALFNLVDNAVKHSPAGQTVTVGLEWQGVQVGLEARSVRPPRYVWLWVEDHGEGIPPEEHERIFERFYRCGSELRRETHGVGIGLSIVKHVVDGHGGRVLVRSAPGQGSRFTMELPLHEPSQ